jgi:hypothetical protein
MLCTTIGRVHNQSAALGSTLIQTNRLECTTTLEVAVLNQNATSPGLLP